MSVPDANLWNADSDQAHMRKGQANKRTSYAVVANVASGSDKLEVSRISAGSLVRRKRVVEVAEVTFHTDFC